MLKKKERKSSKIPREVFEYLTGETIKRLERGDKLYPTVYVVTAKDSSIGFKIINIVFDEAQDELFSTKQEQSVLRHSGKILSEAKIDVDMFISIRARIEAVSMLATGKDMKKNLRIAYYKLQKNKGKTLAIKSPFFEFPDRWFSEKEMKNFDIKLEDQSLAAIYDGYYSKTFKKSR